MLLKVSPRARAALAALLVPIRLRLLVRIPVPLTLLPALAILALALVPKVLATITLSRFSVGLGREGLRSPFGSSLGEAEVPVSATVVPLALPSLST